MNMTQKDETCAFREDLNKKLKHILQLHLFEQIMLNLIILTGKACHFYQGVFEKRKSQKDPVVLNDFI